MGGRVHADSPLDAKNWTYETRGTELGTQPTAIRSIDTTVNVGRSTVSTTSNSNRPMVRVSAADADDRNYQEGRKVPSQEISFCRQPEVRNRVHAISHQTDGANWFAVCRHPLIAVNWDTLGAPRRGRGRKHGHAS